MTQLVTRIPPELAAQLDALVASGAAESRSDAVRVGLELLIERHRRAETGRRIVEGYTRLPQTDAELSWIDQGAAAMITDEPW